MSAGGTMLGGMALAQNEREQFLAEPHIAALSVSAGSDRGPLTVPMWYQYSPGGDVWILTGVNSRKARRINQAGRLTLMVERLQPTVRYVTVEGPVTRVEAMPDAALWEMAERYLPGDKVRSYVAFSQAEHGEQQVITMRPEHWLSADLGAF